jgi:dolichol-phosphate mannosyltransferase
MVLSLVIPLYNEEDLIASVFQRTTEALAKITADFEIICVNDGSTDKTLSLLIDAHHKDSRFKVVELSRNFGHQAAYTAGLSVAKGEFIAMMDGDLQDPPELIAEMYQKITTDDLDIVYGKRNKRREKLPKRLLIKLFHRIFRYLSAINAPANVGNFSIMNRKALHAFLGLQEKNRYLPGLRYFIGFKQGSVSYDRPDREIGEAKMNFTRLACLAFDAIFSFSKLPIKLALVFGTFGLLFSLLGAGVVIYKKIIGVAITGWSSTMLTLFFFGSVQLFFLGILGEYIYRIYKETQNRPIYFIRNYYDS